MRYKSVALIALLSASAASAQGIPRQFQCVQAGGWSCGVDDICIDTLGGGGRKYSFDLVRMRFHSPEGRGKILKRVNDRDQPTLQLSDGTTLTYFPKRLTSKDETVAYLFDDPRHYSELW